MTSSGLRGTVMDEAKITDFDNGLRILGRMIARAYLKDFRQKASQQTSIGVQATVDARPSRHGVQAQTDCLCSYDKEDRRCQRVKATLTTGSISEGYLSEYSETL